MESLIILQARTSSTRLPGKALLPVAGYPSAVLAALRASNLGAQVLVATSDDPTDDALAAALSGYGIRVFRGPMQDVLSRYALAASDLHDEDVVIRFTGDNVVPDGSYAAELFAAFVSSGLEYLRGNSVQSRLPYGLGGEAFSVRALRKAHANATSVYDREHVGPWMSRNCRAGIHVSQGSCGEDYSHLRCTIDDDEDYRRVVLLFEGVSEPLVASSYQLLHKLASLPGEPCFRIPYKMVGGALHSDMTLGTVQLGMPYGIANLTGQPSRPEAVALVRQAIAHGVSHLDTARSYGESEEVLGESLGGAWRSRAEVITKLDPLESLPADASSSQVLAGIEHSILQSRRALATDQLPVLLLHRWHHHDAWRGEVWRRLLEIQASGQIGKLGASVYTPEEALAALRDPHVQHLQIPLNVLDRRWRKQGVDSAARARLDVIVHARSAFLQGILLHSSAIWPIAQDRAESLLQPLSHLEKKFGRQSMADLCLAYVRSQEWITSIVVGCDTISQLHENLGLFRTPKLTEEESAEVENRLQGAPVELLNPSKWKLIHDPVKAR